MTGDPQEAIVNLLRRRNIVSRQWCEDVAADILALFESADLRRIPVTPSDHDLHMEKLW